MSRLSIRQEHSRQLGKNIIFDDDLQITVQVLAAHILWEITYFGFGEEEMKANIGRDYGDESHTPDNIYRRKIQEIEDKQWKNYRRSTRIYTGKVLAVPINI